MKLSIIIPVLSDELALSKISRHLQSIKNQEIEIVIVDGGSTDNTLAVAQEVTDTVIVCPPGRALQMNNGAAVATGDVFLFLHADTFLPDNIVQIISDLSDGKDVWGRFDVRLSSHKIIYRLIERLINLRSCVTSIATGDQAIFIEKNLFDRIGGFPEIALMEDVEISRQLKKISSPVCVKQRVTTSSRRWETKGVVTTVLMMWKLRLYYFMGVSPDKLNRLYR